jgi:hypothetical protein
MGFALNLSWLYEVNKYLECFPCYMVKDNIQYKVSYFVSWNEKLIEFKGRYFFGSDIQKDVKNRSNKYLVLSWKDWKKYENKCT